MRIACLALLFAGGLRAEPEGAAEAVDRVPGERHLRNVRQLTFGGENAEAYFSPDGRELIFQSTRPPHACDQIFRMRLDGTGVVRVSTGRGRTTCAYFLSGGLEIIYSSTHLGSPDCPERPSPFIDGRYVWPIHGAYDIFRADRDGGNLRRLTRNPGYDAEATLSPDGDRIVFTSLREGDIDIYSMNTDGSDVRRLTTRPGYDGGAFFSPDGSRICYRSHYPESAAEAARYRELLERGLVEPSALELYVMDADGSNPVQVTRNGAANFCPFFHPSGEKLIFASNLEQEGGRDFDLYLIGIDGRELERITYHPEFDGFPMFSPDGRMLVWSSNRFNARRGETNIFLADWVE